MISDLIFNADIFSGNILWIDNIQSTGGRVTANSNFDVRDDLTVGKDTQLSGELYVDKNTFLKSDLFVEGDARIEGDLYVSGDQVIMETATVRVEDKNIELAVLDNPTDFSADGGGITLKGSGDKTILWSNTTDSWDISEHLGIADGKYIFADKLRARDAAGLSLEDDGGNGIFIQDGGFVGIGTTNPYGKLHVQFNTGAYINFNYASNQFGDTSNDEAGLNYSNKLHLGAVNSANNPQVTMSLLKDGNVGIGTTSPSETLEVRTIAPAGTGAAERTAKYNGISILTEKDGFTPYNGFGGGIVFNNETYTNGQIYSSAGIYGGIGDNATFPNVGGHLAFHTSDTRTDDPTEKMRIAPGGNVGIGVNSDLHSQLTIGDSSSLTNGAYLSLRNNNSDGGGRLATFGYVTNAITIGTRNESTGAHNPALASFSYNSIRFSTGSSNANITPRMVINTSGNVGIGTLNPAEKLDLNGILRIENTSAPSSTSNKLYSVGGALYWNGGVIHNTTSPQSSVNNSGRTYIQDISLDAYGHVTSISSATETVVDTNTTYSAGLGLNLNSTTFSVENDQRGKIDIIGASISDYINVDSNQTDFVNGGGLRARLFSTGNLHIGGNLVTFASLSASDKKLKSNIETLSGALDKVKSMRGVSFTWNIGCEKNKAGIGVIAQEVEKIIPEVVQESVLSVGEFEGNKEKYKIVDYEKIIPVLIEAIKELSDKLDQKCCPNCNCECKNNKT